VTGRIFLAAAVGALLGLAIQSATIITVADARSAEMQFELSDADLRACSEDPAGWRKAMPLISCL